MHHGESLRRLAKNAPWAEAFTQDGEPSVLEPKLAALAGYARALTLTPQKMTEEHLAPLRQHGYSDEAVLWAAEIIGYFNYVNRVADGLGVELEPHRKTF